MTMPAFVHTSPDHDETLIARLAADDLSEREAVDAHQLVVSCPACAELHADLRSIMAATAHLPVPKRTRDFQLTDADAARLRGTGWRRLLGRLGEPRLAFTRPLATGLVTLGIAGLVLVAAPSFLTSFAGHSATSAPLSAAGAGSTEASGQPSTDYATKSSAGPSIGIVSGSASFAPATAATQGPQAARSPAATSVVPPPAPSAAASALPSDTSLGAASAAPPTDQLPPDNVPGAKIVDVNASSGPSPLAVISIVLLVVGTVLFLLRWVARRPA